MAARKCVIARGSKKRPSFVLGHFSNGKLKNGKGVRFGLLESVEKQKHTTTRKRKLVAETDRMQYLGTNCGTDSPSNLTQNLIGVVNKETGEVKIYDAEMFFLNPYWPNEEKKGEKDEVDNVAKTILEKSDLLTSAFGSSKKRKAMVSRQKNAIKGEALETAVGTAVEDALSKPQHAGKSLEQIKQESAASALPPCDKDATKAADAYPIVGIISNEMYRALQTPAQVFVNSTPTDIVQWKAEEKYPAYISFQLSILPIESSARLSKACRLTYLNYLMSLFRMHVKELRQKQFLPHDVPPVIKQIISTKFTTMSATTGNKQCRCIPARQKDLLLSYILILCLHIDEFNMEINMLMKDLKIGQDRMIKHLRAIGCKVTTIKGELGLGAVRQATLPLPLTFPDMRARTTKGRK